MCTPIKQLNQLRKKTINYKKNHLIFSLLLVPPISKEILRNSHFLFQYVKKFLGVSKKKKFLDTLLIVLLIKSDKHCLLRYQTYAGKDNLKKHQKKCPN